MDDKSKPADRDYAFPTEEMKKEEEKRAREKAGEKENDNTGK